MQFKPAAREARKLRLCLTGPSGSGKTFSALQIARGLVGDRGRIGVIDTENESSALYAGADGIGPFGVLSLTAPYTPERYVEALQAAHTIGCAAVVVDSATHEWTGEGGVLAIVDELAQSFGGDSHRAWGPAGQRHAVLLDAFNKAPFHLIVTLRSKTDYQRGKDRRGKTVIRKVGTKPVQRDGFEYEFDAYGTLDDGHQLYVHKSRITGLDVGDTLTDVGGDLGRRLAVWLDGGDFARPESAETVGEVTYDTLATDEAAVLLDSENAD